MLHAHILVEKKILVILHTSQQLVSIVIQNEDSKQNIMTSFGVICDESSTIRPLGEKQMTRCYAVNDTAWLWPPLCAADH